jgi:hypothetical protein
MGNKFQKISSVAGVGSRCRRDEVVFQLHSNGLRRGSRHRGRRLALPASPTINEADLKVSGQPAFLNKRAKPVAARAA